MNVLRAVDGNADEKIVLGEEIRPLRCQERSIGLECVVDYLVLRIFLLELDGLPVEVESVLASVESKTRLVLSDLNAESVDLTGFDIRQIAYDHVILSVSRQCVEHVS